MPEDAVEPAIPALRRLGRIDAHHRLFTGLVVAAITFCFVPWHLAWPIRALATWDAYNLCTLVLAWFSIMSSDPSQVARNASIQDSSRKLVFVFVMFAACASIFAVAAELGTAKGLDRAHLGEHILFCLITIAGSWALVHTIFTLRYAHHYYDLGDDEKADGGLNFPDEPRPDYLDFAYFSFVIGMTSQVSDVSISSQQIRRLALVHGLISFVFNLAILGLTINIISSLFS